MTLPPIITIASRYKSGRSLRKRLMTAEKCTTISKKKSEGRARKRGKICTKRSARKYTAIKQELDPEKKVWDSTPNIGKPINIRVKLVGRVPKGTKREVRLLRSFPKVSKHIPQTLWGIIALREKPKFSTRVQQLIQLHTHGEKKWPTPFSACPRWKE